MVDKDALLQPRIETAEVEIPGLGTVTVKGLSRWEMLTAGKVSDKGPLYMERAMLHFGMVDPALTEDDVAAWQKAAPANEINPVLHRINELSGVAQGSAKETYKSVGDES